MMMVLKSGLLWLYPSSSSTSSFKNRKGNQALIDKFTLELRSQNPNDQQQESAAILKIRESMQEEAKRFEKDTPSDGGPTDYFMQ